MKIIYNKLIPFPGFLAINLFGTMYVRKNADGTKPKITTVTIRHESIHTEQMKELWYIGFYILYLLFWLWNLVFHTRTAYFAIPFEREAYDNETSYNYLEKREKFAWRHYMKKKVKYEI